MIFFQKTVSRSLLWGLSSTRQDVHNHSRWLSAQKFMVRKMLKISRKPIAWLENGSKVLESWLDWQKRSMSLAGEVIKRTHTCISAALDLERLNWAGHVSRMGINTRPSRMLKAVLCHRNLAWWHTQQAYNKCQEDPIFHRAKMGRIRRWENGLKHNWILKLSCEPKPS